MNIALMSGNIKCPRKVQFFYWDLVLEYEILALLFIRAYRSNDFNLFIQSLEALVPWCFALDRTNYTVDSGPF